MQIVARGLAWPDARDIAAIFLQIVGDLQFVELGSHPEIGEEEDHYPIENDMQPGAIIERAGDLHEKLDVVTAAQKMKYLLGEHQDCLRKDDRHDPGVIHAQR